MRTLWNRDAWSPRHCRRTRSWSPFACYELIKDRCEKLYKPATSSPGRRFLGLASTVQLGWASTGLGSSRDALLYLGSISRGFEPARVHILIASAAISGQLSGGQVRRRRLGAQASYYLPQGKRWLFYAAASGDMLTNPAAADTLLVGGDNSLIALSLPKWRSPSALHGGRGLRRSLCLAPVPHLVCRILRRRPRLGAITSTRQLGLAEQCGLSPAYRQRERCVQQRAARGPDVSARHHCGHEEGAVAGQDQGQFLSLRCARA